MEKNFIPYKENVDLLKVGFSFKTIDEPWFNTHSTENHPSLQPGVLIGVNPSEPLMSSQMHKIGVWNIPAPLYQQAFAWLLEEHGLFAETTLWGDGIGYISRIKQIKQEEFLTVYDLGLVTPRRGLPNWDRKKEEVLSLLKMISIVKTLVNAGRLFQGKVCTHCSAEFKEEHGYPVLCTSCYFESSKEDRAIYEKATKQEI